jgi:predicted enzyme related to lactoylglutathione lyase
MRAIGDLYLYVSDVRRAVDFWVQALRLQVVQHEATPHSAFAVLEFPDGGTNLRLFGPVGAWNEAERPEPGTRPGVGFDVVVSDFEDVLVRILDAGGAQLGEIESYEDLRMVTVADPDGIVFELIEAPPGEPEAS